jgi:hypothetical protein
MRLAPSRQPFNTANPVCPPNLKHGEGQKWYTGGGCSKTRPVEAVKILLDPSLSTKVPGATRVCGRFGELVFHQFGLSIDT